MSKTPLIDLSRTIAFQRSYVTITGSINAALMLSQAVYWTPKAKDPDGWFYKSAEDWEQEIGLTWEQQATARKKLRESGLWDERRGDKTVFFKVQLNVLEKRLEEMMLDHAKANQGKPDRPNQGKPESKSGKAGLANQGKTDLQIRESLISITETTSETTTETTTSSAQQAATGKNGHHVDKEGFKLEPEVATTEQLTWAAYRDAYAKRYKVDPIRNAKVNGQIKQLVKRLGKESPEVAAFFLTHGNSYYITKCHAIGILLADAEKLRTEWATGTKITTTHARQLDKSQTNQDQIARMRAQYEAKP